MVDHAKYLKWEVSYNLNIQKVATKADMAVFNKANQSQEFFSSPEHKVFKVSYCDHPVPIMRRLSSIIYLNDTFS